MPTELYRPDRLEILAEFLDGLSPEKFNFGVVALSDKTEPMCGAVCCAVGWMPRVFPNLCHWAVREWMTEGVLQVDSRRDLLDAWAVSNDEPDEVRECAGDHEVTAAVIFGITLLEAGQLFTPGHESEGQLSGKATPQELAEHIREFIQAFPQEANR